MENNDLKSVATDDLWEFYKKVAAKLAREMAVEKVRLQERLRKIESASNVMTLDRRRRQYPKGFSQIPEPEQSYRDLVGSR